MIKSILGIVIAVVFSAGASIVLAQNQLPSESVSMRFQEISPHNRRLFEELLRSTDPKTRTTTIELARRRPNADYKQLLEAHLEKERDPQVSALCKQVIEEINGSKLPSLVDQSVVLQVHVIQTKALLDYRALNFTGAPIEALDFNRLRSQPELQFLSLPDGVTDTQIKEVSGCRSLRTLFLGKAVVSDIGAAELKLVHSLEALDLSQCGSLRGDCLKSLAALPHLEKLYLPRNINEESLGYLKDFPQLQVLMLCGQVSAKSLSSMPKLGTLKTIVLVDPTISEPELEALRSANPKLLWLVHQRRKSH